MSYYGTPPEMYEEFQPGTAWHQGAPGWSVAPIPGWGQNPNLRGPKRVAVSGCRSCGQDSSSTLTPWLLVGGVLVMGVVLFWKAGQPSSYQQNRRRRYSKNGCRGRGGPYLIPASKKYPVPTKRCARTALTYAGWPNNIDDAPAVLRGMLKTKYADDPAVRDQMKQLARVYREETGKSAPRV